MLQNNELHCVKYHTKINELMIKRVLMPHFFYIFSCISEKKKQNITLYISS